MLNNINMNVGNINIDNTFKNCRHASSMHAMTFSFELIDYAQQLNIYNGYPISKKQIIKMPASYP